MTHLTEVVEHATRIYEMEINALGFWTKPMGYCALVAVFWGKHGSIYTGGRAQHCSGGLGALQVDALFQGIDAPQLAVLIYGLSNEMLSMDTAKLEAFQTKCRNENCPLSGFTWKECFDKRWSLSTQGQLRQATASRR